MKEFVVLTTLAMIASAVFVYFIRRWGLKHLLDIPNERSSHYVPTPRGGGLGIVVTTLVLFGMALLTGDYSEGHASLPLLIFLGCAGVIALIGWIDDRADLSAKARLLIQLGISVIAVLVVGAVTQVELQPLGVVVLVPPLAYLINVVWVVGGTNIYNFMDGIDGIAGVQALIAGGAWSVVLLSHGQIELALFAALLAASSLGFLFLNRPPALIFMGDVGSTFLGFSLAMLPLLAFARTGDPRALGLGGLFIAPFVLDGAFTVIRRAIRHENVLKAHRSHVYQRLVIRGYSHRQITGLYALYALASAGCGLLYDVDGNLLAVIVPVLIFAGLALWAKRRYSEKTLLEQLADDRSPEIISAARET